MSDGEREGAGVRALSFNYWLERILESHAASNLLIIILIFMAAIPLLGIKTFATHPLEPAQLIDTVRTNVTNVGETVRENVTNVYRAVIPGEQPEHVFSCSDGKSIGATFESGEVRLWLSDGRHVTLPQVISASGARYANPNETFVFWNKGNTAFITENGTETYHDCATE